MYSITFRSTLCWIAAAALLLTSCDSADYEDQPQVTVRLLQSKVTDGSVTDVFELAAFEVPVHNNLHRDSAFAEAMSLPAGDPVEWSFGSSCSGRSADFNDDVIFWFVERIGSDKIASSGVTAPCGRLFNDARGAASKNAETLDGTFIAFSVEGIGGTSTAPLRLSVGGRSGSADESSFEYHAERHQLPPDHLLLHFDESAVRPFLPLEEASGLTIEVTARGADLNEGAFLFALAKPVPTYGTINGEYREGSTIRWDGRALADGARMTEASSKRGRITYLLDKVPEELDFYLVALGER